jgi:hypothetical protein
LRLLCDVFERCSDAGRAVAPNSLPQGESNPSGCEINFPKSMGCETTRQGRQWPARELAALSYPPP